ncbi:zinc finger protein 77-like [Zootermopsis nevadensis]|uniref:zinc finger protein 77-like n=1 Tax=Zootermopsis nevadensis TaxID=136037 RepID=UPI000B8E6DFA|nr:zinc finger protein 77-like [Zootermopsis nevadensis]
MVQDVQKRLREEKFEFSQEVSVKSKVELTVAGTTFHPNKTSLGCGQDDSVVTVNIGPDGKVECMLCRTYLEVVSHTTLHMVTHGIGTVICRCRACGQQGELAQFLRTSSIGEVANTVWCNGCHSANKLKGSPNDDGSSPCGRKAYVCEVCSKSFRSNGHLARHHLVHSGAKPFLCEVCGTGFSQSSSLKLHVQSHSGLNPHKCPHCGQTFRFRVSLRSHILSLHVSPSSTSSPAAKNGDYGCDRCGKQFATVYKLHRHYRSHTGERPYECTRCGKLFSQTGNLNLHRRMPLQDVFPRHQVLTVLL